ncbi:TonB-dependent receptor [Chitinophaga alhagiae]|uniref:TonB-dependent receptor n=1 Tax=Chitinophaga alhagiae TaxID=2203219 RepID=UPI001E46A020|nr:TonB-dependent receptor [Chitinophaga alhagiae]
MKCTLRMQCLLFVMLLATWQTGRAQTQHTLTGTVVNSSTGQGMPGVTVSVKGAATGAVTNASGEFRFNTTRSLPLTLVFSYVGFKSQEVAVTDAGQAVNVQLASTEILGQEVVVSASRVTQSILESPVSIEKLSTRAIREAPAPSFYDGITNLKGVESSVQSYTFRSITTRGFNANGNTRFNQFIDGMDNQAPGLNFSVGNIVGISELDVESVELLPGAASALYGAGGINGTLLMNSKSPFDYQGLSVQLKAAINHVGPSPRGSVGFIPDISARYAKAFGKFAFKVNVGYMQVEDWQAVDSTNFDRLGLKTKPGYSHRDDPNYDGINVYGDEISQNMQSVANAVLAQGRAGYIAQYMAGSGGVPPSETQIANFLSTNATTRPFFLGMAGGVIPNSNVSRTGYNEVNLVDYGAKSLRTSTALHYRFHSDLELIAQANWGMGTSVYTGTDRYSLSNFNLGQYKLELRGKNYFLRGYTTQERSGEAYNATALASFINEGWKPSQTWFPQYVGNFVGAKSLGASDEAAHAAARAAADQGRFAPGSPEFAAAKDSISKKYIGVGPGKNGAKFDDKTNLYHYEGMYNFSDLIKIFELQVGASYRRYALNSGGTIFDDANREIKIDEYGSFLQVGKKFANDRIKLTGSVRFDKNENFEGRFTPRFTGVFTVAKDNNIRLSYQTGFRNPTTQNQYIDLLVRAQTRQIGGIPELINKYQLNTNEGYTQESVQRFQQTGNVADLQKHTFTEFRPESVQAYEVGYRGLIKGRLLIDAYYYYNAYKDFINTIVLLQTADGTPAGLASANIFATVVNNPEKVVTQGWALGLDYVVNTWNVSGNVSYNDMTKKPASLYNDFNTPKVRFNLGLGNRNVYKNIGFNLNFRWQDEYTWNSTFGVNEVPAYSTLDGMISYRIPTAKTTIKLGGSNLLNKYYETSFGNPRIGAVYYLSLTFDELFR